MNKHKLESLLRSIKHYQDEAFKIKAALEIVCDTRNDLIVSIADYFPFEVGDVIFRLKSMETIIIDKIERSYLNGQDEAVIEVSAFLQQSERGAYKESSKIAKRLTEWQEFKKVN